MPTPPAGNIVRDVRLLVQTLDATQVAALSDTTADLTTPGYRWLRGQCRICSGDHGSPQASAVCGRGYEGG